MDKVQSIRIIDDPYRVTISVMLANIPQAAKLLKDARPAISLHHRVYAQPDGDTSWTDGDQARQPGHSSASGIRSRCSARIQVLDLDPRPGRYPAERRHAEHPAALDHLAAGLGERRDAELHAARECLAVPRRRRAAVVLLPDAHPGKIRAPPARSRTPARSRGEKATNQACGRDRVHQVRGVRARHRRIGEDVAGPRCRHRGEERAAIRIQQRGPGSRRCRIPASSTFERVADARNSRRAASPGTADRA